MIEIIHLAAEFEKRFKSLETHFNNLSAAQKSAVTYNSKLPPTPTKTEDSFFLPPPPPPNSENVSDPLEQFHLAADSVLELLRVLQPLVKLKQSQIPSMEEAMEMNKEGNDGEIPEKFESLPRPLWLETLIQKYITHVPSRPQPPTNCSDPIFSSPILSPPPSTPSVSLSAPLPPVGSLASFLSCCVTDQIDCTETENRAIHELILASSDQYGGHILSYDPLSIQQEIFTHTQRYWANRFFQFLKKLTELKSAVKDEKNLYLFQKFL